MKKRTLIIGIIICLVLAVSFFAGGKPPQNTNETVKQEYSAANANKDTGIQNETSDAEVRSSVDEGDIPSEVEINHHTVQKTYDSEEHLTCTLTVECTSVLDNLDMLKEGKESIIPKGGIFYHEDAVAFTEGESVFDVLLRELKNKGVHFEFVDTPMYDSKYIEGIGNLYEFDCGDYSGWTYKVNGMKATYGCSKYLLKDGDRVEIIYTCNFLDNKQ